MTITQRTRAICRTLNPSPPGDAPLGKKSVDFTVRQAETGRQLLATLPGK